MADAVPPEAARLYSLPLDDFVAERNALARELRQEGRREEAEVVRSLRRPSVALWAVNQLGGRRGDELEQLLAAGERVRKGDAVAADDVSAAIDRLVGAAREVLQESGHAASDTTLQRAASTLRAAVADETNAAALAEGRLTDELEPAGFEAMAALIGAPAPRRQPKEAAAPARERDTRRLRDARAAVDAADKRVRELRRAADAAEREARRARGEAERAESELARAEEALRRLEQR